MTRFFGPSSMPPSMMRSFQKRGKRLSLKALLITKLGVWFPTKRFDEEALVANDLATYLVNPRQERSDTPR